MSVVFFLPVVVSVLCTAVGVLFPPRGCSLHRRGCSRHRRGCAPQAFGDGGGVANDMVISTRPVRQEVAYVRAPPGVDYETQGPIMMDMCVTDFSKAVLALSAFTVFDIY